MHTGLETYDRDVALGMDTLEATANGMKAAAISSQELLGQSTDNRRTLHTLMRALAKYGQHWENDPIKTSIHPVTGKPAVEIRFEVPIPGTRYRMSGRIDRLGDEDGQVCIVEHKTTVAALDERYWRTFSPNTQVYGYVWALRDILGIDIHSVVIDAITSGVGYTRFARQTFYITEEQTQEWIKEAVYWMDRTREAHNTGFFPRNLSSCGNYGGCKFRGVCLRSPGTIRNEWLSDVYVKRPERKA